MLLNDNEQNDCHQAKHGYGRSDPRFGSQLYSQNGAERRNPRRRDARSTKSTVVHCSSIMDLPMFAPR